MESSAEADDEPPTTRPRVEFVHIGSVRSKNTDYLHHELSVPVSLNEEHEPDILDDPLLNDELLKEFPEVERRKA